MLKKQYIYLFLLLFSLWSSCAFAQDLFESAKSALLGKSTPGLQELLEKTSIKIESVTLEPAELKRFYSLRGYKPVWNADTKEGRAALKDFMDNISSFTRYHGLQEKKYPYQLFEKLADSQKEEDSTRLELLVTHWLLRLAHEMHGDSVNLALLYPGWTFRRKPLDAAEELEKAVKENRVYEFLDGLAPENPAYQRLARELDKYRAIAEKGPWPAVTPGPTLRPGDRDPRVAELRQRLAAEGYLAFTAAAGDMAGESSSPDFYDESLLVTVENYQSRNGLDPDGNVGVKTISALNVPVSRRVDQIIANMERWRHMPETLPSRYAAVNIASAEVEVIEDGKRLYWGPVVVGRPDRKTPFIYSAIRSVIFNPSWHVPDKIARHDILPKLRKDPHYLEKMGFVISGSGLDSEDGTEIDWESLRESEFHFRLRQAPGDLNSLGRIKFDFDNNFSVYMHGTPHKELFEKADRNKSSGCVRLRDPDLFAALVLSRNEGEWTESRVQEEIGKGKTRWLKVSDPLPLYFVYWSVFPPEDDGPVNFRNDVYGYDRFLMETLRKNGFGE